MNALDVGERVKTATAII